MADKGELLPRYSEEAIIAFDDAYADDHMESTEMKQDVGQNELYSFEVYEKS